VGIYLHAIDVADGVLDATAPNPVRNAQFTRALGAALHRPAIVPVPAFAVSLLLGEAASVIVQGQRVLPTRTLASGYRFKYEMVDSAMRAIAAG
jgi:NAD dependent epimerase/dehydratase family enzyme